MLMTKELLLGYGLVISYVLMATVSCVSYQFMDRQVPDFEANGVRFAFGIIVTGIMVLARKESISIPREQLPYVLLVSFTKLTFIFLYFGGISILPFTHASGIGFGLQGFFAALISKFYHGESIKRHIAPIVMGLGGVLLVVQPWKGFSDGFIPAFMETSNITNATSSQDNLVPSINVTYLVTIGYTLVFIAAATEAFTMTIISSKLKKIKSSTLVFIISCVAIPLSIVLSLYLEEPVLITKPLVIILLTIHSITIGLAIVMQITACQILDPTEVLIFANLQTLLFLIPQYTMTGGALYGRLNVLEGLGCVLIVISLSLSVLTFRNGSHEDF